MNSALRIGFRKRADWIATKLKGPLLLDGEIVATDAKGRPLPFGRIQGRIHLTAATDIARAEKAQPAALIVFDRLAVGTNEPSDAGELRY